MKRWWCRWRRIHVTAKYRRRSGVGAAKLFSEALQIAAPKAARSTAPPTRALAQVGRRARCGEAACDKGPRPTILVLVGSNRGGVFCFVPLWYGDSFRAQLVSQSLLPGRFFPPLPGGDRGGACSSAMVPHSPSRCKAQLCLSYCAVVSGVHVQHRLQCVVLRLNRVTYNIAVDGIITPTTTAACSRNEAGRAGLVDARLLSTKRCGHFDSCGGCGWSTS